MNVEQRTYTIHLICMKLDIEDVYIKRDLLSSRDYPRGNFPLRRRLFLEHYHAHSFIRVTVCARVIHETLSVDTHIMLLANKRSRFSGVVKHSQNVY